MHTYNYIKQIVDSKLCLLKTKQDFRGYKKCWDNISKKIHVTKYNLKYKINILELIAI
jgi:hypothetical protein